MSSLSKITLIIMSFLVLKNDQCKKLKKIINCRLLMLKDNNNKSKTLKKIRERNYMHN